MKNFSMRVGTAWLVLAGSAFGAESTVQCVGGVVAQCLTKLSITKTAPRKVQKERAKILATAKTVQSQLRNLITMEWGTDGDSRFTKFLPSGAVLADAARGSEFLSVAAYRAHLARLQTYLEQKTDASSATYLVLDDPASILIALEMMRDGYAVVDGLTPELKKETAAPQIRAGRNNRRTKLLSWTTGTIGFLGGLVGTVFGIAEIDRMLADPISPTNAFDNVLVPVLVGGAAVSWLTYFLGKWTGKALFANTANYEALVAAKQNVVSLALDLRNAALDKGADRVTLPAAVRTWLEDVISTEVQSERQPALKHLALRDGAKMADVFYVRNGTTGKAELQLVYRNE